MGEVSAALLTTIKMTGGTFDERDGNSGVRSAAAVDHGGAYVVLVARRWDFVMEALMDAIEEADRDED